MAEQTVENPLNTGIYKLGLALSGGGFRASLFHIGVLARMAELDLLRYVEVLSTVSGGSIVGALYVLLLKQRLDQAGTLTRDDYISIIKAVQQTMVAGIQMNLRTRLFMNPFGILRALLTQHSLGIRMARIYERYLYRHVVSQLQPRRGWRRWCRPGAILLRRVRFIPGGEQIKGGIEQYNRQAVANKGSAIPNLILNATSLNSGAPFRFSSVEVGDPRLGFFRYDEIESELMPRKRLLQHVPFQNLAQAAANPANATAVYAAWWRAFRERRPAPSTPNIFVSVPELPGPLMQAEFGMLRRAKVPAWYLRRGLPNNITGGVNRNTHSQRFWNALEAIDPDLTQTLRTRVAGTPGLEDQLLDFILHLYYLRSAEMMSPRTLDDWDRLTLGEAVGASACFPPVFPPIVLLGFYDDLWVTRLGLTDGGVYDNLGITSLLDEDCTYIIGSDTGGIFDVEQRVSTGRAGMMARVGSVLMDHVGGLQRTALRERRRVSRAIVGATGGTNLGQLKTFYGLDGLAYFHINAPPLPGIGLQQNLDRDALARLRTDLDAFGEVEIAALINHGYDTADRYIRGYLNNSPYVDPAYWQPPTNPPISLRPAADRVQRILIVGRSRFFRALKLKAVVSWIFTLTVLGLLIWETFDIPLSVSDAVYWLANQTIKWIEDFVPWLAPGWGRYPVSVGVALLAAVAAGLIAKEVWPRLIGHFKYRHPRLIRKFVFIVKWLHSLATNLLWLFGGAPIWIAFGVAVGAWFSYIFYNLPFLCKTRNRL